MIIVFRVYFFSQQKKTPHTIPLPSPPLSLSPQGLPNTVPLPDDFFFVDDVRPEEALPFAGEHTPPVWKKCPLFLPPRKASLSWEECCGRYWTLHSYAKWWHFRVGIVGHCPRCYTIMPCPRVLDIDGCTGEPMLCQSTRRFLLVNPAEPLVTCSSLCSSCLNVIFAS